MVRRKRLTLWDNRQQNACKATHLSLFLSLSLSLSLPLSLWSNSVVIVDYGSMKFRFSSVYLRKLLFKKISRYEFWQRCDTNVRVMHGSKSLLPLYKLLGICAKICTHWWMDRMTNTQIDRIQVMYPFSSNWIELMRGIHCYVSFHELGPGSAIISKGVILTVVPTSRS